MSFRQRLKGWLSNVLAGAAKRRAQDMGYRLECDAMPICGLLALSMITILCPPTLTGQTVWITMLSVVENVTNLRLTIPTKK